MKLLTYWLFSRSNSLAAGRLHIFIWQSTYTPWAIKHVPLYLGS